MEYVLAYSTKPAATVNCEIALQEHQVFAQLIS